MTYKLHSMLLVLVALASLSSVFAVTGPNLDVTLLRYEPLPARPGDTITVWLQVANNGDATADNVLVNVGDSYPFTPAGATDRQVNAGTIAAHSEFVTKVTILIDRNAPEGTFKLPVSVKIGPNSVNRDLTIQVESGTASLSVKDITTKPEELTPGSRATISITVENIEQTLLRDFTVSLGLADSVFAPVGNTNQQKISRLDGGAIQTFTFEVIAEPDTASNVYRIPVTFDFTTSDGTRLSQQETIGVVVQAKPELSVVVDEADVHKDESGTVLIRLVNKGLSEIKFVETAIQDGDGYVVTGNARTVYVGNIDSDDFETTEFAIKPTKDTFNLALHLTYRDALNNPYEETIQLPLVTQPKAKQSNSSLVFIIVVVLAIGGFIWWRRSRKAKR